MIENGMLEAAKKHVFNPKTAFCKTGILGVFRQNNDFTGSIERAKIGTYPEYKQPVLNHAKG